MAILKRIRGAIGMGITWAAGWAAAGFLIGLSSNLFPNLPWERLFDVFDAPLVMLAVPGFLGGVLFSVVLGIAARRKKFDELSIPRFAAWGATGGLLLSLIPALFVGFGLASGDSRHSLVQVTAMIGAPLVILSAISASVSLLISRRARDRSAGNPINDAAAVGISADREQLPEGSVFLDQAAKTRSSARIH